jgi:hypothetical protein
MSVGSCFDSIVEDVTVLVNVEFRVAYIVNQPFMSLYC